MICNETLSLEEIRNGKNRTYTAKLECIIQFYRTYKGVMGKFKKRHSGQTREPPTIRFGSSC